MKTLTRWSLILLPFAAMIAASSHEASAQVGLGTAESFAVLGGSAVTNTGSSTIVGDLGISPGLTVTGFPPGLVTAGTIHAGDAVALQAQQDTTTAYDALAGQVCGHDLTGQDLGGLTLTQGVYCFSSSAQLTGTLRLDAQGNADAVFVFQTGSTLTTASDASVVVINGGQLCNVFWQVGSSATIGTTTSFVGNVLALTSITLTTGAQVSGRALARNGAVTMDTNHIAVSGCAVPPVTPTPPTLGKAFGPATIDAGGTSTLTLTLSNTDPTAAVLSADLVDTLPGGVVVAASPNAGSTCVGGTVAAAAGGSTVTLSAGASIPAHASCTVTVDVTAPSGGSYVNSLAVGALQTGNGSNAGPAVATLTVNTPAAIAPTLGKAFDPATIEAGGTSTLTVTLSNTDPTAATLSADLIDRLPSGVVVASSPNASTTCIGGTVTAAAGSTTVTLSTGTSIPGHGSCTVTVHVTAPSVGSYVNSLATGALQTDHGSNAGPALATLTVLPTTSIPPTIIKGFGPASINAGGVTTLIIILTNPDGRIANLTAPLIDFLPSGLVVADSPNASFTCSGGTPAPRPAPYSAVSPSPVTAVPGSSTVTLTSGSIPAHGYCTLKVNVTARFPGTYINTLPAGALQTDHGSNVAPAVATLTVHPSPFVAPGLSKSFSPATINLGGFSTLTITLSNPNSAIATLTAALVDVFPSGVVVTGNARTTCGAGMLMIPAPGTTKVILKGGAIPANGSCTVTVDVTARRTGTYNNTLPAGALKTDKGSNVAAAAATLTVQAQPVTNGVGPLQAALFRALILRQRP